MPYGAPGRQTEMRSPGPWRREERDPSCASRQLEQAKTFVVVEIPPAEANRHGLSEAPSEKILESR